ncbi:MAG: hypothetical protein FWE42_00970 [Defluviitaleaceae bacterium]|nr:hypothetical protein [Defluviitaleaceae bacterium]
MLPTNLYEALWLIAVAGTLALIIAVILFALKEMPIKRLVIGAIACFVAGFMVVVVYAAVPVHDNGRDSLYYVDAVAVGHSRHHDPFNSWTMRYLSDNNLSVSDIAENPSFLLEILSERMYHGEQIVSVSWCGDMPRRLIIEFTHGDAYENIVAAFGSQAPMVMAYGPIASITNVILEMVGFDVYWDEILVRTIGLIDILFGHQHIWTSPQFGIRSMDTDFIEYMLFYSDAEASTFENNTIERQYDYYELSEVINDEYADDVSYDVDNTQVHPLVGSWATSRISCNFSTNENEYLIYYVFRDDGQGTVTEINLDWRVNNGVLFICRSHLLCCSVDAISGCMTHALCGVSCDTAVSWRYSINGDILTLTSIEAPIGTYTFARASAVGAVEYIRPLPPTGNRWACFEPVERIVFWIPGTGTVWHSRRNCHHIVNSRNVRRGTISQSGLRGCSACT